ncbi:MAG: DUF2066 domain-containing protein [Gammaproteobacteria bacterium]|nr:DUF2066 domain-containing protein [Gammaproteobacteria bacterium]
MVRIIVTLVCTLFLCGRVQALEIPDWLYAVEQPVQGQSEQQRQLAASQALLVMLTRLTGLVSVPRTPIIKAALDNPARFYDRYVFFEETDAQGNDQQILSMTFHSEVVVDLVRQANLPIWWSQRPTIVVWVVLEIDGRRELLGARSKHPLIGALKARARYRGLELIIPTLDAADQNAVTAQDVWGRFTDTLDAASARYAADIVLTARVQETGTSTENPNLQVDWQFWLAQQPYTGRVSVGDYDNVAIPAIDAVVDELIDRYVVPARAARSVSVAVAGLSGMGPYADLMAYLETFEFIDQVQVTSLRDGVLYLSLRSPAEGRRLVELLTAQNRLVTDSTHIGVGVQLLWQG